MKGIPWKLLVAAGVLLVLIGLGLTGLFSKFASSQPAPVAFSWPTNQPGLPPGGTPLHGAARFGNPGIITSLIRTGSKVDVRDGIGGTPLHWAVSGGSVENAKTLLSHGADINAADNLGNTPLHLVSRSDYDVIPVPPPPPWQTRLVLRWPWARKPMQWLIKHRLLPAPKPVTGPWPTTTWLDVLADHRANVNATNLAGETPLHLLAGRPTHSGAATSNLVHRMSRLVKAGARVDAQDAAGNSLLHITAQAHGGRADLTAWLLDRGAPINARNNAGRTPLNECLQPHHNIYSAAAIVSLLLDRGADWTIADARGRTPLHEIAANQMGSFTPLMQPLVGRLAAPPANPLALDLEGNLPIDLALRSNRLSTASAIIQHGGLPLVTNQGQTTLFHTIAGRPEWFLALGPGLRAVSPPAAVVDVPDARGETPLLLATRQGDSHYILWLLERGADVARTGPDGCNFLYHVANNLQSLAQQPDVINRLRERLTPGVPVDLPDEQGNTPLLLALRNRNSSMINLLTDKGARPTLTNRLGESPLLLAAEVPFVTPVKAPGATVGLPEAAIRGDLASVNATLAAEPRLATNGTGATALVRAARTGQTAIVDRLLAAGTPLDMESALWLGRSDSFRTLLAAKPKQDTDALGNLLCIAVALRRFNESKQLLEAGASVHARDWRGHSALVVARGTPFADELRKRGAEENLVDAIVSSDSNRIAELVSRQPALLKTEIGYGRTALMIAVLAGDTNAVAALLRAGAEANHDTGEGVTAAHIAARRDDAPMLRLLQAHGAAIDRRDRYGQMPIHHAALMGRPAAVEYLIDHGVNVNEHAVSRSFGPATSMATPLHLAARFGHFRVVEVLLRHGADVNATQLQRQTVLEFVRVAPLGGRATALPYLPYLNTTERSVPSGLQTESDRQRMLELLERHQARAKSSGTSPSTR